MVMGPSTKNDGNNEDEEIRFLINYKGRARNGPAIFMRISTHDRWLGDDVGLRSSRCTS